jgi:hypothetical protein
MITRKLLLCACLSASAASAGLASDAPAPEAPRFKMGIGVQF